MVISSLLIAVLVLLTQSSILFHGCSPHITQLFPELSISGLLLHLRTSNIINKAQSLHQSPSALDHTNYSLMKSIIKSLWCLIWACLGNRAKAGQACKQQGNHRHTWVGKALPDPQVQAFPSTAKATNPCPQMPHPRGF